MNPDDNTFGWYALAAAAGFLLLVLMSIQGCTIQVSDKRVDLLQEQVAQKADAAKVESFARAMTTSVGQLSDRIGKLEEK